MYPKNGTSHTSTCGSHRKGVRKCLLMWLFTVLAASAFINFLEEFFQKPPFVCTHGTSVFSKNYVLQAIHL